MAGLARRDLRLRFGVAVLLLFLAAIPAYAARPVLKELAPMGGQRGKTFTLTVKGEGLVVGSEIVSTLPGTISKLAPPKDVETPETQLSFLVQLPEDAPVGLYPIRIYNENGVSNLMILSVEDFPEISEKEPNNSIAEAQPINVPVAIDGTLKAADQDFYRFTAKAHQRLVMEVEARRLGSAIDPVLEVFDANGQRIAFNDDDPVLGVDSRLDFTFPKDGIYYVVVHDSKYSEQETTFYRLKIGSYAYAEGIFPLGWQRGKDVEVTFFGGNLAKPVRVHPNLAVPPGRQSIPINLPGPKPMGCLPFQFQISDFPEVIAPGNASVMQLESSTVVNGRISKPHQVDKYKFKVSPGQDWMIDLKAASLGTSRLYGSVTVYDLQGKKVPTKDLGGGADSKITFKVPEKVNEVTLAVEDVRGQGGPWYGYRLLATQGSGDFDLKLVTPFVNVPAHGTAAVEVVAERHGYGGPIQLSIPDLPSDFTLSGGNIATAVLDYYEGRVEQSTNGYLTLTAKPGARPRPLELSVWGQGGTPDHPIRKLAQAPGVIFSVAGEELVNLTGDVFPAKPVTFPSLGILLPVAIGKPAPAELQVAAPQNIRAVQGVEFPVNYKLVKFAPGIVLSGVAALPPPSIKGLDFGQDKQENKDKSKIPDQGKLLINSMVDTPLVKLDVVPVASLQINGKEETVVAPAFTMELVRAYSIALTSERVEVKSGGKVELAGTIHREPIFSEPIKIKVADPPDKVTCPEIEVAKDKSEFRLVCEVAPVAQEGDFEVHLVSSATNPGHVDKRDCTIPPLTAHMVVAGEKAGQTVASKTGKGGT